MLASAVAGLISGGAYAVLGVCVVLLYRMVGVLNLAQAATGVFGAYVLMAAAGKGWPLLAGVLAGVLVSGLIGAAFGWIMSRWFAEASVQTRSSVTIALLIGILTAGWRVFGTNPRTAPVFSDRTFEVAGVVISLPTVLIILLAAVLAWGLSEFLRRTRLGVQLRALSERATAAELLGVPTRPLTIGVWAFVGAVSSLAVMLIAPTRTPDFTLLSMLILPAMAAALAGAFRSFPVTIAAGLVIGLIEGLGSAIEVVAPYRQVLWFVVMLFALLWTQRRAVWDAAR